VSNADQGHGTGPTFCIIINFCKSEIGLRFGGKYVPPGLTLKTVHFSHIVCVSIPRDCRNKQPLCRYVKDQSG
jgi:hypothetical protein